VILIEDKASGVQLCQELKREDNYTVKAIKPQGDKPIRMNAQTVSSDTKVDPRDDTNIDPLG
jgi:phage terminase large subunit-like protein